MKRRAFIALLGGAAAWPVAARAQQGGRVRRIGVLSVLAADDPESRIGGAAFAHELQQRGWTIDRDLRIDYRWGGGSTDDTRKYAVELAALAPEVILAIGSPAVTAFRQTVRAAP